MLLAQGRYWRAVRVRNSRNHREGRDGAGIALSVLKDALGDDQRDLKDLQIDVPMHRWNRVVKNARGDRKLLGGVLLDFAKHKDLVSAAVANDRIYSELRRVIVDATVSAVEQGDLSLAVVDVGTD